jgi:ligand-binding sensor domain-containing protein/DNA-binding CsgD family transcriptional regulator
MSKNNIAFLIFLFVGATSFCQHSPPVFNYKVSDYKAHPQNWSIQQTKDSLMYFGNTDGLLSFNGNLWTLSKLPNNKTIRSLLSVGDRIYSGAYGDIGYWEKQECADYAYRSLSSLVPDNSIEKEEIWHIISHKGIVYFQSFSILLAYDGKKIKKISLPGNIMYLHIVNEKILFQVLDQGIFELIDDYKIKKLPNTEWFSGMTITSILAFKNSELLVTTNSNGIFIYNNGIIKDWKKSMNFHFSEVQINKAIISRDGDIVLGTIRDGLMVFSLDGTLKYHINSLNGLQNNTVLSIFEDRSHNLWFGLDRGISIVVTGDQTQRYYDYRGVLGTVYTAACLDSVLYLGTNQGVYYFDQKKKEYNYLNDFKLVKGTQGQVWELKVYDGQLFCGHNEGSFLIKGSYSQKVSTVNGGWYSSVISTKNDKYILQSTYTGFVVYSTNNGMKYSYRVEGINIPIKKFVLDYDFNVWAITPNDELYKFSLDSNFTRIIKTKKYGINEGLPILSKLDVISIDNRIWVFTGNNKYRFDGSKQAFIVDSQYDYLSCDDCIIRKLDDARWALLYKDSISIYRDSQRINSFNISVNMEYNSIVMLNGRQLVFCLNEGYAISDSKIDLNKSKIRIPLHFTKLEYVKTKQCIPLNLDDVLEIPYNRNHIKIHFYKTDFTQDKIFYYKLDDDTPWQAVKDMSFVEFSNLRPNQYKLWIKSIDGHVSEPIEFVILQPWYFSKLAWFFYVLLFFGALKLLKIYFDKKLTQEKIRLESENERLLREHKYELENNRLIQDNLLKSKELANATMHLVQKNELLQEIKEELIDVRKTGDHTLTTKDFQNLMKIINQNMTVDDDRNFFESNFNDVHEAFFKKMKSEFPELTIPDLKLAAYLKMNLSSKEIAPLFNISIRGLENKRYRLRKKLGLPNDFNLSEYFYNLK